MWRCGGIKIKHSTVKTLNRISRKKSIWCMGCGKRFYEMIELYESEPFVDNIEVILDSNSAMSGISARVSNKNLQISLPNELQSMDEHSILLITSDHYTEILNSIQGLLKKNISVFLYPDFYFNYTKILLRLCSIFVSKRQILFYAGKEPHENADEIVRYLKNEDSANKFIPIYVVDESGSEIDNVICINKWTGRRRADFLEVLRYSYYYGRSKYICYENEPLKKMSRRQVLIYLNHGTIPLKNVSDVLKQPTEVDIATCPGEGCSDLYINQYGISKQKHIYMMPARTRRLFIESSAFIKKGDEKLILWLPTFRQLQGSERKDSNVTNPIELLNRNIESIDRILKENNTILYIKKHPREKSELFISKNIDNIRILEEKTMLEEGYTLIDILREVDALLTDYSGIAFEYMLLNRPIGYVILDIDEYSRGFSIPNPFEYMPGVKIENSSDLCTFITDVSKRETDVYESKRKQLVSNLFGTHAFEDGAREFVNYLKNR